MFIYFLFRRWSVFLLSFSPIRCNFPWRADRRFQLLRYHLQHCCITYSIFIIYICISYSHLLGVCNIITLNTVGSVNSRSYNLYSRKFFKPRLLGSCPSERPLQRFRRCNLNVFVTLITLVYRNWRRRLLHNSVHSISSSRWGSGVLILLFLFLRFWQKGIEGKICVSLWDLYYVLRWFPLETSIFLLLDHSSGPGPLVLCFVVLQVPGGWVVFCQ